MRIHPKNVKHRQDKNTMSQTAGGAREEDDDDDLRNRRLRSEAEKRCLKHACQIQACLSKNQFQQSSCTDAIAAWNSCVTKFHQELSLAAKPFF
ncbi:hypothetical protein BASA81_008725 [Batrachochytrium salamandrivorans]|nr:hypothetical protein BASA81_008725 [Batrachochytrium salamandrivorans]